MNLITISGISIKYFQLVLAKSGNLDRFKVLIVNP
jgi:hypothetical protein